MKSRRVNTGCVYTQTATVGNWDSILLEVPLKGDHVRMMLSTDTNLWFSSLGGLSKLLQARQSLSENGGERSSRGDIHCNCRGTQGWVPCFGSG